MSNLIEYAKSANHCQRNWSDRHIEEHIVEELIGVAVNMPTKQNEEFYGLLVSTDSKFNHTTYLHSYSSLHKNIDKIPFERRHLTNHNTQLRAPLQFHYLIEYGKKFQYNTLEQNGFISIGVSAGAVALAANQLGLKTGFCCCLDIVPMMEIINADFNTNYNSILVSLGIGYPNERLEHNVGIRPDTNKKFKKETFVKDIKVFRK